MADKSIEQLTEAEKVYTSDLFLLQQSGAAKKLSGNTLKNWLLEIAESLGGIASIDKVSTSGLVDTYRITYAKSTETTDFTVTNGAKGDKGDNMYIWIKYTGAQPTASSHAMGDTPDDWIGIYYGTASTAPTDWSQYKWFQIKGEKGDTGAPATLNSSSVSYMVSDNGTVVPSGSWQSTIPQVPQGKYLWTRTVNAFNTGNPVTSYSVSRMGIDGSGAVSSVNGVSPDSDGNVSLTAENIQASDNQSVQDVIDEKQSKITTAGLLKGNGSGGVSEAVAGTDYQAPVRSYTATIPASGWTGSAAPYTCNVTVTGLLAADKPIVDIVPSATYATAEAQSEAYGYIYRMVAQANKIVAYATEKPTVDIPIQVKAV